VAGTNVDSDNLSILMTACDLNPDLFMVGRQNRDDNGGSCSLPERWTW
jgi:voltage-gated potassium channel